MRHTVNINEGGRERETNIGKLCHTPIKLICEDEEH